MELGGAMSKGFTEQDGLREGKRCVTSVSSSFRRNTMPSDNFERLPLLESAGRHREHARDARLDTGKDEKTYETRAQ
jgi:hypothetical protein